MKTQRLELSNGEKYSILLGDDGIPLHYENLFVTVIYRGSSLSSNTCYKAFEHLRLLNEICDALQIDLVARCQTGCFLQKYEFQQLKRAATFDVESMREMFIRHKASNVLPFKFNSKKLESARAVIVIDEKGTISPHTAYNRVTTFAQYIDWLEKELCPSKAERSNTLEMLLGMRPNRLPPSEKGYVDWDDWSSLTKDQVIEVLDVVEPNSTRNPWKSESVRYRNELIVNMYEALGCRRGELMKVRVKTDNKPSDVLTNPQNGRRAVRIRSNVDRDDNRTDRPEGKTSGRIVPMDSRLAKMYDNYLVNHRPNSTGSEYIPYLFVTHNHKTDSNSALSLAQVNKIFRQISVVVGYWVHPHALRHTWNDHFSEVADRRITEKKTTESKSEADRRKLMGWSENSKSGQHYAKRHTDRRAMDIGLEMQEKNSKLIGEVVGSYDNDIDM